MKKVLFLLLIPFVAFANIGFINECVTDVYFANGIMNSKEDAQKSLDLIKKEIGIKFYNGDKNKMYKHHNFDTAYNESYGIVPDLFESLLQKIDESPEAKLTWSMFKELLSKFYNLDKVVEFFEALANMLKDADLST